MKRFLAVLICALLVTSLALPATALAAKGGVSNGNGNGRANAPGQQYHAPEAQAEVSPDQAAPGTDQESAVPGNGRAVGRPQTAGPHASETGSETVSVRDREHVREQSREASETPGPTRSGIQNAFDRISANIARAEAHVASGSRSSLPPGLVRVFEKFLEWLGLVPDDEPVDDADNGQDTEEPSDSDETTQSPDPDSSEETQTPAP